MRNRYLFVLDLPLVAIAAFGAFTLRFDWLVLTSRPEFFGFLITALIVKPVFLYAFGMYERYWRYASINDLLALLLAVSSSSVAMAIYVAAGMALGVVAQFSRPVVAIDWLLCLALVAGLRLSIRVIAEAQQKAQRHLSSRSHGRRVLIAGAGEAGAMVVRELQRNPQLAITPVGFLDDSPAKRGKSIAGVRVIGPLRELAMHAATHRVEQVIIAMPAVGGAVVRAISEMCRQAGIESRTVPGVFELLDGQVHVSGVRQLDIADLLRRPPVVGEVDASAYVSGRRVLVTGAGGSIGRELCRQLAKAQPDLLVLVGHGENSLFDAKVRLDELYPDLRTQLVLLDVRDEGRLSTIFRQHRPEIVFHAAAHKHVPIVEEHPEEAITNNIAGTRNIVEAALSVGTSRLMMISTDKAVAPRSIMGASKRVAEMVVRDAAIRHSVPYGVVRFGNVLGSRGSVVPFFQRQIERGGPVTVTHPDTKRFFMTIPEAVHLVLQAAGLVTQGELFVLDMGEPVRIVDLARDMIRLASRTEEEIPIVFTGLRPGEKLEETLWEPDAQIERTLHPNVLRVLEPQSCSGSDLAYAVRRLVDAAASGDRLAIEDSFARAISTYVPASIV